MSANASLILAVAPDVRYAGCGTFLTVDASTCGFNFAHIVANFPCIQQYMRPFWFDCKKDSNQTNGALAIDMQGFYALTPEGAVPQ